MANRNSSQWPAGSHCACVTLLSTQPPGWWHPGAQWLGIFPTTLLPCSCFIAADPCWKGEIAWIALCDYIRAELLCTGILKWKWKWICRFCIKIRMLFFHWKYCCSLPVVVGSAAQTEEAEMWLLKDLNYAFLYLNNLFDQTSFFKLVFAHPRHKIRVREWFGLKRTLKIMQFQLPLQVSHSKLLRALSSPVLNTSRDGESMTSLVNQNKTTPFFFSVDIWGDF